MSDYKNQSIGAGMQQQAQNAINQTASQVDHLVRRLQGILSEANKFTDRTDSIANRVVGFQPEKGAAALGAPTPVASSALDLVAEIERIFSHIDRHLTRIDG